MELRQPGTITPLPEIKIESDGGNTDTTQDHYKTRVDRDEPRGEPEEVQMEQVDPVPEKDFGPLPPSKMCKTQNMCKTP